MKPQPSLWAIENAAYSQIKASIELATIELTAEQMEARMGGLEVNKGGGVATIPIRGPLFKDEGWLTMLFEGTAYRSISEAVTQAAADSDVKTIVLVIDSPGGVADGMLEAAEAVYEAAQSKRIVAQVDGMCASAAYAIASQATEIRAHRNDWVGSIGVKWMWYDYSKMYEEAGIRPVSITTGEFKGTGEDGTEITEAQEAYLQGLVDDSMAEFVALVKRGRSKMSAADLKAATDGRVFTAKSKTAPENSALTLHLIDGIASVSETLAAAVKRGSNKRRARAALLSAEMTTIE